MIETIIIGHLGSDSEVRTLEDGRKLLSFSVAVTDKYKGRDGNMVEKTTWVKCTQWDIKDSQLFNYLKKGQQVFVKGEPSASSYLKDGAAMASLELKVVGFNAIKLLGPAKLAGNTEATPTPTPTPSIG